jgi:AraC-like DNA-binding protein/mannose-6-phosphate isomerase-like protein (cupin superfamily)
MKPAHSARWLYPFDPRRSGLPELRESGCHTYVAAYPDVPHRHSTNRMELLRIDDGEQTITINGRHYSVRRDQGAIVRPGERHGDVHLVTQPGQISFLVLDLRAARRQGWGLSRPAAQWLSASLHSITQPCFPFSPLATALWNSIMQAVRQHGPAGIFPPPARLAIRLQLAALLAELAACAHRHSATQAQGTSLADQATRLIDAHLDRQVSAKELAEAAHMSPSYYQGRFKRETGVSPIRYIRRRRMEHAKHRLCSTDDSVTQIALDFGYSSSQNFATAFRRVTYRSPQRYRIDMRELSQNGAVTPP